MNHALINKNNEVVNVIWWEGAPYTPPEGHFLVKSDIASIGDSYQSEKGCFLKADGKSYKVDLNMSDYLAGEAHEKE